MVQQTNYIRRIRVKWTYLFAAVREEKIINSAEYSPEFVMLLEI